MKYIFSVLIMFISLSAFAQDTNFQNGSEDAEMKATKITDQYNAELGLRAKQELLFRKKVEEFILRAEDIKRNYKGREMLNKLLINQKNETAELGNILTRPQLEKYKEVRPRIQPLSKVEQ